MNQNSKNQAFKRHQFFSQIIAYEYFFGLLNCICPHLSKNQFTFNFSQLKILQPFFAILQLESEINKTTPRKKIEQAKSIVYKPCKVLYNKPITQFIFIYIVKRQMQIDQKPLSQTLQSIYQDIQQRTRISQSQIKELISKLTTLLFTSKSSDVGAIRICLKILLHIEKKTFNLNSKHIPEFWKLFINLLLQVCLHSGKLNGNLQKLDISSATLQDFYKVILSIKMTQLNQKLNPCSVEDFELILKVWNKSFCFSDIRSLQYALLSLQICWTLQECFQKPYVQKINQSIMEITQKVCLNLLKYAQRTKEFDTYENMLRLIDKIETDFYKKFEKQIQNGIGYFCQASRLALGTNSQNIHVNVWEKIVLAQCACMSKKLNNIKSVEEAIVCLEKLRRSLLFQKMINLSKDGKRTYSSLCLNISASQLEQFLLGMLLDIWTNIQICYESQIQYAKEEFNEKEQKELNCKFTKYKTQLLDFFKILTKRELNILMVRELVKRLQIVKHSSAVPQWKQIFVVIHLFLISYPTPQNLIQFTDEKSYISKSFSPALKFPFTVQLKVKGQSIPFKEEKILIQFSDPSSKEKIWITMRNYEKNLIIFSFVKLVKNNFIGKEQKEFKWNQYECNTIEIVLKSNKIKLSINKNEQNTLLMSNSLAKVEQMVLCDRQNGMGSTICQIFHFKVIQYSIFEDNEKKQVDLVPFIDPRCSIKDPMKENLKFHKCKKVYQNSMINFMETLGDLELFMLLLYHTLKKIKNQDELLNLIRMILNLLEEFTLHKQVVHKQLSEQQKDSRRKSILCLSWFFAKETKSVFIIFELMRFLYIRGKRCNEEILKFLCNFSYWRDFKLDKQILIVMKIKQILKESSKEQEKVHNLIYCKKLMFDMVLYFKESHYLMAEKQSCLKLHRFILETVYEQIKDIIEMPNKKSKICILDILFFLQFTTNLVSCILNRKISQQAFDITFVIQITLFLRDVAKLLFVSKERKFITKNDIDAALEVYFKKEQKELIVPLSLNAQELLDERFNLYLTRIMSTSKSLITLFDTETFYFEESQFKVYPINCQSPIYCNDTKVHTNVINFNIYMSMLSEKSWNYILFSMPLSEYTQRFCQSLWRICFYELFKEKKYFPKMCKMLQLTPLPQSEYCLMKIFEVLVFYPMFDKEYLYRVLKSQNFTKSICPFKIQQIMIKYLNKLEPQFCEMHEKQALLNINYQNQKETIGNVQQERMYFVLLHSPHTDYDSCKDLLAPLRYRKSYSSYNIIVYHIILKSLVKFSQLKISERKQQNNEVQSSVQLTQQQKSKSRQLSVIKQSFGQDSETSSMDNSILSQYKQFQNDENQNLITQKSYDELISLGLQSLEFYLKLLTLNNVKEFFKVQSNEDAEAHRLNFTINLQCMIKALKICKEQRSSRQFQKFLSFIEFYLMKFSLHKIKGKFPSFKAEVSEDLNGQDNTKKGRSKLLYKTLFIDLVRISTQFFVDQVKQRRSELHNLEQMWNEVEKKNKFFWNLFISQNKYFSLSEITTKYGERLLLTISNDKPKIELPKMINKQSMMCSMSLVSTQKVDAYDQSELSTLFDECELLKTQLQENDCKNKERARKGSNCLNPKQIKTKKFKVLFITNDKIYQGLLFMTQKDLMRFEETYPSERLYDKIGATAQERRDDDEIEKDPRCFDIILGSESKVFYRKYLFFDAGIEIFSHEKATFFCFDSDQKRTKFCSLYLKESKVFTFQNMKKAIQNDTSKWLKGLISNYEYLMKINQCANRTINDLSQYYVMPWTITQFEKKEIDKTYIFEVQNFRDLKKPLGKASQKKWKQINTRFQMSFASSQSIIQSDMEPFLYGAFYSNPAIVTNYMIRLEPFSSLHYLLQSEKIDVADRLFFQFSDQYRSIMTNTSDIKELIPEFYINPQFLKNRSKLNLGSRQNKEIVNDVRLPKWAENAYEFAFKMQYFLQSPIVSKYLSHWIDLIFGVYAKKQNALTADNLYMSEIYGPNEVKEKQKSEDKNITSRQRFEEMKNSTLEELENRILFNKEFGIIPMTMFDEKHPQMETMDEYYVFKGIVETLFSFPQGSKEISSEISMIQNFCIISAPKSLKLIDTNSADYNQKENLKLVTQIDLQTQIHTSKLIQGHKLGSLLPYLFYVKRFQRKICSRYIKKAKIFGSLELKDEYEVLDGQCFNCIDDQVLVVGHNNMLKIYSFQECSIRQKNAKVTHLKIQQAKPAVPVREFPIFTQHQAEISFIQTNNDLKLIVSLDQINKVFILKYSPDEIELINSFTIKNCHFEEKIIKLLVHKMSLIICLTNYQRLLTFNFYGDLIGAKEIGFTLDTNKVTEKVNCIKIFNKEGSELLMGTNLGNVWKVDIFEFYKTENQIAVKDLWFQKISLNNKDTSYDIKDLKVKRYGRHWQIYAVSMDQNKRKVINKIRCLTMKQLY